LDDLNGGVARAVEQRRAYHEEVNHYYDPIQRLPVEIATSIFSFCLPLLASLDVFDVDEGDIAIHPIQFTLGSVCRYWRQVVCSTPEMWNILCVHISLCTPEVRSEILAEWLDRSGQLPLYVYIDDCGDEENEDGPQPGTIAWSSTHRMMNILFLNANRIRVLHISLLGSQFSHFNWLQDANPTTKAVTTTSCILEKLSIQVITYPAIEPFPKFELRSWILSPMYVSLDTIEPAQVGIQWGHVTHFEAVKILHEEVLEILQIASRLQYLKLDISDCDVHLDQPILFTHFSLKSLDVSTPVLANFLDHINCPALEEFSSHLRCGDPFVLQNFIKRSGCSLKRLTFVPPKYTDLVSVLRLTPSLIHLSLNHFGFPDEFWEIFTETACFQQGAFAKGNSEGSFLPHLCSFTCKVKFDGFQWSKIPSLIPRPCDDTNLVCRPLSEIEIVLTRVTTDRAKHTTMVRENLVQALDLARDRGVLLKITDFDGTNLTRIFGIHEMYAD